MTEDVRIITAEAAGGRGSRCGTPVSFKLFAPIQLYIYPVIKAILGLLKAIARKVPSARLIRPELFNEEIMPADTGMPEASPMAAGKQPSRDIPRLFPNTGYMKRVMLR